MTDMLVHNSHTYSSHKGTKFQIHDNIIHTSKKDIFPNRYCRTYWNLQQEKTNLQGHFQILDLDEIGSKITKALAISTRSWVIALE